MDFFKEPHDSYFVKKSLNTIRTLESLFLSHTKMPFLESKYYFLKIGHFIRIK